MRCAVIGNTEQKECECEREFVEFLFSDNDIIRDTHTHTQVRAQMNSLQATTLKRINSTEIHTIQEQ